MVITPHIFFSQESNEVHCVDDQEVNYLNFDKLTLRNNSTFRSETHTIRSDYIKGKQEQCRGKFKNAFMDVRQVNYIDKIYLGLFTFPTKLFSDQD